MSKSISNEKIINYYLDKKTGYKSPYKLYNPSLSFPNLC